MKTIVTREPLLAAITALVTTTITLLVAFGVPVSNTQGAAILGFVAALYGVAGYVRKRVTPTTVESRDVVARREE